MRNRRWAVLATRMMYLVAAVLMAVCIIAGRGSAYFTNYPPASAPAMLYFAGAADPFSAATWQAQRKLDREWAGIRQYVTAECKTLAWQVKHEGLCITVMWKAAP